MEEYMGDNGEANPSTTQAHSLRTGSKKQQRKARDPSSEDYTTNQMTHCLQHLEDLKSGQDHICHTLTTLVEHLQSTLRSSVQEAPTVDSPGSPDTLAAISAKTKVQAPLPIPPTHRSERVGKAKKRAADSLVNPTPSEKAISNFHLAGTSSIKGALHSQLAENKNVYLNAQGDKLDHKIKSDERKPEEPCELSKQLLIDAMWSTWKQTSETQHSLEADQLIDQLKYSDEVKARLNGEPQMKVPLSPTSSVRVLWDLLSIPVIGYDLVVLPFVASFDLGESATMNIISVCITIYWTLDVFFTLATGYQYKGVLEMRASMVLTRYLRSWFLIDVVVLTVDYLGIFVTSFERGSAYVALARVPKMMRIFRVLRLLRLRRVNQDRRNVGLAFFTYLDDYAEEIVAGWAIWRLVFMIFFVNHFLACAWHGIGMSSKGTPSSWVEEIKDGSVWWYYASAFHWAIAQFCPSAIDIHPRNLSERCFALFICVFGLVGFSSFTSSLTTEFTQWRRARAEINKQKELLHRYISTHRMPVEMAGRLQMALRKSFQNSQRDCRIIEKDIKLFSVDSGLPDDFRKELRGEISVPILANVPVLFYINFIDRPLLFHICYRAVSEDRLPSGKTLFDGGDVCKKMIILNSGNAEYRHRLGTYNVLPTDYFAEMCLWFQWEYKGRLVASRVVTYFEVDSNIFRTVIENDGSPKMMASLKAYVKVYVEEISAHWAREPTTDIYRQTRNNVRIVFGEQLVTNTPHGDVRNTWLSKLQGVFSFARE